jgi:uncharacterized protein (DUF1810 family)
MSLQRFLDAQQSTYTQALTEIRSGRKQSHWMWFIFPQLAGLGKSETAKYYGIKDTREAAEYVSHPMLGQRLVEISNALLSIEGRSANQVFGSPDDLKLLSCMTLFSCVSGPDSVFNEVLLKYFGGRKDGNTLKMISENF